MDIVAVDDGSTVLVGECKWRSVATGAEQLLKLDQRARLAGADRMAQRWLFSRGGFTQGCTELASEMNTARLIAFEEMVRG